MKRIVSATPTILSILYAFLPLCHIIGVVSGYDFVLLDYPTFIAILTIVSLALLSLFLILKESLNNVNAVFSALLLPLSVINGLYFIFDSNWKPTIVLVIVCCGCAAVLFMKFARPTALIIAMSVLSIFLILLLLLLLFSFIKYLGIGCNKVVKSLASPQNTYIAKVIDSDQGALGGDTFVDVHINKDKINILFGQFTKSPIRIYTGEWGEFKNMQISWKDEHTLIIDNEEYCISD